MMMNADSVFQEHTARLNEPTAEAVRDAFAALPRRGCIECVCRWERRLEALAALEECGAFAITLEPVDAFGSARVVALKGKSGPCYDTGRSAVYRGEAAAVLDDDRHLIVGTIRVCEKTGGIYALWPYRGVLAVTEADPALLARLDSEPVPFDCNTFDADCLRLAEMLETAHRPTPDSPLSAVVYPGPLRALVLKDGSVVRRGVAALVPESYVGQNGLLRLPPAQAREAQPCETYVLACRERGAAFILETLGSDAKRVVVANAPAVSELTGAALAALRASPRDLKRLLLRLIVAREPYLVLTGSDPDVAGGCCPSTQVGAANRLVAAGALQSYAPPAPPGSCTVTFYAFPGEIVGVHNGNPEFHLCEPVRAQVEAALRDDRWDGLKRLVRRGLLVLLGVSLGLSAWRTLVQSQADRESRLCAVCAAAARLSHRVASQGSAEAAEAVSLGALSAIQPCALALLAGVMAFTWKPGAGIWTATGRNGLLAAGAGLSNAALTLTAAWGSSRVFGGMSNGVQAFAGPLMILGGLPMTGVFRIPSLQVPGSAKGIGFLRLFLLGATLGVLWCPVGIGLLAGVLLPSALRQGAVMRDAALFSAGYAVAIFCVGLLVSAGGSVGRLLTAGRYICVMTGWLLILTGAIWALA